MPDVAVIGAGQAGLATAYWLRRLAPHLEVVVLERSGRLGQVWLDRWHSLRLFTPRAYSALPGMAFPDGTTESPDRREMADYLQAYAERLELPVLLGVEVRSVVPAEAGFSLRLGEGAVQARQVVVASGPFHDPSVPPVARDLGPAVHQLHSVDYRTPADVPTASVAVVGGGNSAAQIALELRRTQAVTLVTPGEPRCVPSHLLGITSYAWMSWLGLLDADADGRLVRTLRRRGDAVFGRELVRALRRAELALRPSRVVGASTDALHLEDGTELPVEAVLWCTGFHSRYDWLDVPGALDGEGNPLHRHGASPVRGLHWMGLPWQRTLASSIIHGVDADARLTAERIVAG